jgi:hypothetical protein
VRAGAGPSQSTQQLGDQTFPFQRADTGDDREPRVEVDGDRLDTGLQQETLEPHTVSFGFFSVWLEGRQPRDGKIVPRFVRTPS